MTDPFNPALAVALLMMVTLAGCSDRPLDSSANALGSDTHPEWSPDGSSIAFISNREGVRAGLPINFEVYLASGEGENEQRLTTNQHFEADVAWAPDGSTILFKSFQDGNDEIYALDLRTGRARNLTNSPASDGGPSWSPDGATIVFHSDRGSPPSSLYLMNADGSNVRPLPHDPGPGHTPRWSPDGRHIAFVSQRAGNGEIYVADADGANVRRITHDSRENGYPRWSPDGTSIANTVGSFDTDRWVVLLMDADGNNTRQIIDDTDSGNVTWSPDGTQLLFGRYSRYGESGGDESRLFRLRVNGTEAPTPIGRLAARANDHGQRQSGR
jgi:TolB protein